MPRIAVIQTAFPGDVILSTAMFRAIHDKYPGCEIVAVVRPECESLVESNPLVNDVVVFDKYGIDRGLSGIMRMAGKLRGCEKAFIVQRHARSAAIAFLAGIKERVGFDSSLAGMLYNRRIKYREDLHEVKRCLSLLNIDDDKYRPELHIPDESMSRGNELLEVAGIKGDFAVVAPGSVWPTKRYPYYPGLIHLIGERMKLQVILIGGKDDIETSVEIVEGCRKSPVNLVGLSSLMESTAIISRAKIVFANDSAPAHMAAAVGVPAVAIFGPTVPAFGFAPYSDHSKTVDIGELYCRPCSRHGTKKCPQKHFRCMLDLQPRKIIEAGLSLFGK